MGQVQSNHKDILNQHFNIVRTISPGQFWVRRKKKGDQLQLRVLTFYLQQQMQEYMRLLDRRKKIKNPHLLQLIQHTQINQQNMCSASFKIRTLVQYPFKTIKDQILERSHSHPKRFFNEDQIWSILYSCCYALHILYLNNFNHEALNTTQIFIDTTGIIKIADTVLVNCQKNHLSLLNDITSQPAIRYISPELVNLVEDNHFYFYQKEKSDVFILGMIMLQISNLQAVKYYNKRTKKFTFDNSTKSLQQAKNNYSCQLIQLLQRMLLFDFKSRPKFQDILTAIQQKTVYTSSSANTSFLSNEGKTQKAVCKSKENPFKPKNIQIHKHDRHLSLPPLNNISIIQNSSQSHYLPKAPKDFPYITPTDSVFNFQPKVSQSISHPLSNELQLKQQINLGLQHISNSYVPFYDSFKSYTGIHAYQQFNKLDTVLRNVDKKTDESYTPYLQLLNLTEKNNRLPTKSISNFNGNKIQTAMSQPAQKPKISIKFNSIPQKLQNINAPKILQAYTNSLQNRENHRFSQAKFGRIELPNITANFSQACTVNQVKKQAELDIKPFETPSITPHPGTFIIQFFQQGKFQGFKIDNKKNGVGRFIYVNGSYYEGEWKDDMMNGFGKLYYSNGQIAYEGHWHNSTFQGTGKLYNEDPIYSTKDPIDYTDLSSVENRWVSYQGQFLNDEKSGKGTLLLANGQTFTGLFFRDMAEGEGSYYKLSGEIIEGRWSKNLYIGA